MSKFKEGQLIQAIYFSDESALCVDNLPGEDANVIKIEVIMENGQMDGVPWFLVTEAGGSQAKWNAAKVEGVRLLPDTGEID